MKRSLRKRTPPLWTASEIRLVHRPGHIHIQLEAIDKGLLTKSDNLQQNSKLRLLVVSRDGPLLHTRDLMLGTFFSVCTAGTVAEARNLIEQERFDLLVLCHSLTEEECRHLTKLAHRKRSTVKVLATSPRGRDVKPWADVQIGVDLGSYGLVKACADMLGFRMKSKARSLASHG